MRRASASPGTTLIRERKCYSCQNCGTQVYPTAGTIFHKSKVPLPDWFYVIFQFSKTRTGIAAKQIQARCLLPYGPSYVQYDP